jgi:DNA-directed RNA polymerase specialized sigma24 family protein
MTPAQWGILVASALAGLVILALVAVLVRFRRQQRRDATTAAQVPSGPTVADAQQLDAKIAELRDLLVQADLRLDELRSLTLGGAGDEPPRLSVALPPARRDQILLMDTEGLDTVEIARRMDMDVCEVRLVLNLQRTQQQAP